jgi:PAS domain S-box-containing protein
MSTENIKKTSGKSNDPYRTIVEKANEAIVVTQHDKIVFANAKAAEQSGYTITELTKIPFMKLIYPPDQELIKNNYESSVKDKSALHVFSFRLVTKNSTVKWMEISTALVDWENEAATLCFISDISEKVNIKRQRDDMEQKALMASHLTAVGEMASGIAHEINNPLTSIVLFSQLLLEESLSDSVKRDVKAIHDSALRATNTIRRLLAFARQQLLEKSYIDVNEVLEVTIELRKYSLETSNIKVTMDLDVGLPITLADSEQLQQVFLNIILNAETELKESKGKGNIFIKTEQKDKFIRISIKDDGPGIPKEYLRKIFDPFFTTREVGQGTGLGLSVCHGIISEHGGRIYAESTLGKGATFFIELPIIGKESSEFKADTSPETIPANKGKVLIVDDEQSILNALGRLLNREGHKTETTDNCHDAIKLIKNNNYDIILLDIKLPDMSGIDLYEVMEKMNPSLLKKIIFITGDNMDILTQKFLEKTKARFFAKPFDYKVLIREINSLLINTQ